MRDSMTSTRSHAVLATSADEFCVCQTGWSAIREVVCVL
jgi:hypothetical protein